MTPPPSGSRVLRLAGPLLCGLWCVLTLAPRAAGAAGEADRPGGLLLDRASLRVDPGGHTAGLTAIAAARDGQTIATASLDRTVRLWDARTGALLRTLRPPSQPSGPEGLLLSVALSPDGRTVATGGITRFWDDPEGRAGSAYLFDASSGALRGRLKTRRPGGADDRIERVVFSPDGRRVALTRGEDRSVGVYDAQSGAPVDAALAQDGPFRDADFDAAGRLLLCRSSGYLRVFDAALDKPIDARLADALPLRARFSPDGRRIAVLYPSGRIELRAARDLKPLRLIPATVARLETASALVFSEGGGAVWVAGIDGASGQPVIRSVSLGDKGPPVATLSVPQPADGAVRALAALPGGAIAFASQDGSWGVVAPGGAVRRYGGLWARTAVPEALRVDEHGEQIELVPEPGGKAVLRFSVPTLELQLSPPAEAAASASKPPRTELPPPHRLTGWRHQPPVMLDAAALFGREQDPAALSLAPDAGGFVLGTSRELLDYRLVPAAPGACPFQASPASQLKPPCFARAVPSAITALNHSGDGRFVVALHEDGTVRWYDARGGTERLALWVRPGEPRWVLFRPDGRYAAAPGSADLLGYQINAATEQAADFYPLGRLRATHERPEEVAATLRVPGPGPSPAPAPAPAPGPVLREQLPPVTTILEPADGATIAAAQVTVRVAVRVPSGQPVTAVRARVDGRPVARGVVVLGSGPDAPPPLPDGSTLHTLAVALPAGDCVLSVTAESAAGASAPALLRLHVRAPAAAPARPPKPTLRVLAIGVGEYERPELRLRYPGKDARDLAALLGRPGALYESVDAKVLTDRGATKAAVLEALDWLQHRAGETDTSVIFLAGHGIREAATGEYYFLPADADPASALRTMLPASTFQQVLAALPGRVLLLLDTCHAGGVLPGRRLRGLPAHARALDELASAEAGVVVMAAATGAQASAEDEKWQNGAFTKALLEGLGGRADLLHTGRVTVNMLDLYVSERVRALTAGAQTPATAKPSTVPDFPLVLSGAPAPAPAQSPQSPQSQ